MTGFAEGTPTVEIQLGGKSYTLGFTLGAMRRAKDLGLLKVDAESEVEFMLALPEYVWACLLEEDRNALSVKDIGELMNPYNVKPIAEAVGKLIAASLPKADPEVKAEPAAVKQPTAGSSTSNSSGRLESTISA